MEEAATSASTVAPLEDVDVDNIIDIGDLIEAGDPTVGAEFNLQAPNAAEAPTSVVCNPSRNPRDRSMKDVKNKEVTFDDGCDSDGNMGPFCDRTDKEGPQLFDEDDDDGVGFVDERLIDDERDIVGDTAVDDADADVAVPVPIDPETLNKMNVVQLKNELKLREL